MHKKNRRYQQRKKREFRNREKAKREQVQELLDHPFQNRGHVRRASELFSVGCTEEETNQLFRRLYELGMKTDKIRLLCSVITAQAKIVKSEQEERKIRAVEMRDYIPVSPSSATNAIDPQDGAGNEGMPQPIAFLEEIVTEQELAETLKVLIDTGIADRMIEVIDPSNNVKNEQELT